MKRLECKKSLLQGEYKDLSPVDLRDRIAKDFETTREVVDRFQILCASMWVGDYEASAWFLLRCRETGDLFEIHAGHCSCYGFEEQFKPEKTTLEYLKSEHFSPGYGCGDKATTQAFLKEVL